MRKREIDNKMVWRVKPRQEKWQTCTYVLNFGIDRMNLDTPHLWHLLIMELLEEGWLFKKKNVE